jgi:F-type H+-transporting ATPase subunit epsilon
MSMSVEQQAQIKATGGALTVGGTTDMLFRPEHDHRLRCVIVTPERAILDKPADFVVLPMIDGELGVLPSHAPLIGRLGTGELRITVDNAIQKWQVSGGFAQIRANVVTVLTGKATQSEAA